MDDLKSWLCQLPQTDFKMQNGKLEYYSDGTADNDQPPDEAKAQLMENMAQLWLQQEVKDLEAGHHDTKGKYSPYLVVHHMAMINHLFAIKDIVASKRFAVIVPISGE